MKPLAAAVVLLLCSAAAAKLWVVEIPTVTGQEMAPAVLRGDRLLVYRLNRSPSRGALVLLERPDTSQLLVRRVVGLPAETVAVIAETPVVGKERAQRAPRGELQLDEGPPERSSLARRRLVRETLGGVSYEVLKDPKRRSVDANPVVLQDAYFVLADDRNHGTDSRTFGPVPASKIVGVVTHRVTAGPSSIPGMPARQGWMRLTP